MLHVIEEAQEDDRDFLAQGGTEPEESEEQTFDGKTVRACLEAVNALFPGFGEQVLDPAGQVHRFVNLFVNGDEIGRDELEHPVQDDDEVEILAAIGGG